MFGFVGRCMRMSIATMIMCQNETRYAYTTIVDSVNNIKTGEYIHATLEPSENPKVKTYTIGVLFSRSFSPDMTPGRRMDSFRWNILALRVAYADSAPAATELELRDGMWNDMHNRSVNGIFYESSYGGLQFDRDTSRVTTVRINASIDSTRTLGCDMNQLLAVVGPAADTAGIDTRAYTHVQYIIPDDFGSVCEWSGLSTIGCSVPGGYRLDCMSILRHPTVFTRAHELGHNFGMLHAAGCGDFAGECSGDISDEYGDPTAIMGGASNPDQTGGFIAPNRINMGWMGNITDGSTDGGYAIGALSAWPSADDTAITIPCTCPASAQMGVPCEIIVSYRVQTRIDTNLLDEFALSVSIHLQSATEIGNTLLLTSLWLGDSYVLPTGKVIFVCEADTTYAIIYIGDEYAVVSACGFLSPQDKNTEIAIGVIVGLFLLLVCAAISVNVYKIRRRR